MKLKSVNSNKLNDFFWSKTQEQLTKQLQGQLIRGLRGRLEATVSNNLWRVLFDEITKR